MNPIALTAHIVIVTLGLTLHWIGVDWDAGLTLAIAASVALCAALVLGAGRKSTNKHRAEGIFSDTSFLGELLYRALHFDNPVMAATGRHHHASD